MPNKIKLFQRQNDNYKTENVFVIGNGISRKEIDLTSLDGITIGCNLLYKDFIPTKLTSICYHIIADIALHRSDLLKLFVVPQIALSYCTHRIKNILYNNNCVHKNLMMSYLTTGNFAIDHALKSYKPRNLHLIGFDNDITNMYYGHEYYNTYKGSSSTDWRKNLNQLNYLLRTYKEII